ncbi:MULTISPECIES: O-antigen ligase family protein [Brevibacillus]|uniref:O-antigen ligase family protein n=1 Tax=Brevibacillus TaxID=55080 RepID=UPI00156BC309|nr:O-antigen ligase family protein [Brevibacillus sp. RS1.1]NRR03481.1 O-antigen ligase family protein [Brevibacillus sp. RS1.1]
MKTQLNYIRDNGIVTEGFLLIWVVSIMSADLKITLFSKVHWVVSLLFLLPVFLLNDKKIGNNKFVMYLLVPAILLISSILISSFYSHNYLYDFFQAGKIAAILIGCYLFFLVRSELAQLAFKGFIISAYMNFILLVLGVLSFTQLASIMTLDGRWGTFLNYPGSLSKVGVVVYVYAAFQLFNRTALSISNIMLLISSVFIVYFDGSRTSEISLILGTIYLFVILLIEYVKNISRPRFSSIVVSVLVLALVLSVAKVSVDKITLSIETKRAIEIAKIESAKEAELAKQKPTSNSVKQEEVSTAPVEVPTSDELKQSNDRTGSVFANMSTNGILAGIASSDPIRFQMIITALDEIVSHPWVGQGIGTTKYQTETGPIVVHNAYLQTWADLGILGLLALIGLYFGWIIKLPTVMRYIQSSINVKERSLYYNSIFILLYMSFSALFHPLSTEWSEWILFIIASAIYWGCTKRKEVPVHG